MKKVIKQHDTKAIAHRGASGYETENTLAAIRKALELNVYMIELDIHMCKTGEIVLMHDAKINRTTNGKGKVKNFSLAQLQSFKAKNGEIIPTLIETLNVINKKAIVNINIKETSVINETIRIIQHYIKTKGWAYEHFIIASPDVRKLKKIHQLDPQIRVSLIVILLPRLLIKLMGNDNLFAIQPHRRIFSKSLVMFAQQKKLKIFPYPVNNKKEIVKMKQLGVDGIISDFPDKIASTFPSA